MASNKTPEARSEFLEKASKRAKKSYKTNLNKRRTDVSAEELEIITMQVVVLKAIGGYSNMQCAAIVGLSKGQVRDIVQDEKFQKKLNAVKTSLPQAAVQLGQAFLVEGVMAVAHVMRTETDNALVLKAAAELFDRFGIPKTTKSEIKTDESKPDPLATGGGVMDRLKSASPEVQEAVAALHDSFLEGVERTLNGGLDGSD